MAIGRVAKFFNKLLIILESRERTVVLMNEAIQYHVTTPEEWISTVEELTKDRNTMNILIELQLIPFDKLQSAPDHFVFDYFTYLVRNYDYSVCEIAEESGVTKREVYDLMKKVDFSPKNVVRLSPDEDPLVLFSAEDKKKIREYIRHSQFKKTINLETIRKLLARWEYPRDVSIETQAEYYFMFNSEKVFLEFMEGSPWSKPDAQELAEASTSRITSLKPHRINYVNFLSFTEFLALSEEVKKSYIIFMIRLGAHTRQKFAKILGVCKSRVERIVDEFELYDEEIDEVGVLSTQRCFEDSALEYYLGDEPVTISIKRAVILAETNKHRTGFYGSVESAVREMTRCLVMKSRAEFDAARNERKGKEHIDMAKNSKKAHVTLEGVIGKKAAEMRLCDLDKAIKGCPVEPIHDRKKVISDTEYLRTVRLYFGPAISAKFIRKYLFKDQSDKSDVYLCKVINSLNVGKTKKTPGRDDLYAVAAFIGWATGDYDTVTRFIEETEAMFKEKGAELRNRRMAKKQEAERATVLDDGSTTCHPAIAKDTTSAIAAPEPECEAKPEARDTSNDCNAAKAKTATIVLDASMPGFGKAMAALYGEYADVIISVHQE